VQRLGLTGHSVQNLRADFSGAGKIADPRFLLSQSQGFFESYGLRHPASIPADCLSTPQAWRI
jgi:hypothetical protein